MAKATFKIRMIEQDMNGGYDYQNPKAGHVYKKEFDVENPKSDLVDLIYQMCEIERVYDIPFLIAFGTRTNYYLVTPECQVLDEQSPYTLTPGTPRIDRTNSRVKMVPFIKPLAEEEE